MSWVIDWWRRLEWWRLEALKPIFTVLWVLGFYFWALVFGYTSSATAILAMPRELSVPYTLPYLPANVVVYKDFANREGGILEGGGMGSPDGSPYDLDQFKADSADQVTTLVVTSVSNLAKDYTGLVYVTYWARRSDGTTIHFKKLVGESPSGSSLAGYKMMETERVHPKVLEGKLVIPYSLEDHTFLMFLRAVIMGIGGAVIGYCLLLVGRSVGWFFGFIRERRRLNRLRKK